MWGGIHLCLCPCGRRCCSVAPLSIPVAFRTNSIDTCTSRDVEDTQETGRHGGRGTEGTTYGCATQRVTQKQKHRACVHVMHLSSLSEASFTLNHNESDCHALAVRFASYDRLRQCLALQAITVSAPSPLPYNARSAFACTNSRFSPIAVLPSSCTAALSFSALDIVHVGIHPHQCLLRLLQIRPPFLASRATSPSSSPASRFSPASPCGQRVSPHVRRRELTYHQRALHKGQLADYFSYLLSLPAFSSSILSNRYQTELRRRYFFALSSLAA